MTYCDTGLSWASYIYIYIYICIHYIYTVKWIEMTPWPVCICVNVHIQTYKCGGSHSHPCVCSGFAVTVFTVTSKSVTIRWTAVPGARHYRLMATTHLYATFAMFNNDTVIGSVRVQYPNTEYIMRFDAMDGDYNVIDHRSVGALTGQLTRPDPTHFHFLINDEQASMLMLSPFQWNLILLFFVLYCGGTMFRKVLFFLFITSGFTSVSDLWPLQLLRYQILERPTPSRATASPWSSPTRPGRSATSWGRCLTSRTSSWRPRSQGPRAPCRGCSPTPNTISPSCPSTVAGGASPHTTSRAGQVHAGMSPWSRHAAYLEFIILQIKWGKSH